jgi:hypothetical protein
MQPQLNLNLPWKDNEQKQLGQFVIPKANISALDDWDVLQTSQYLTWVFKTQPFYYDVTNPSIKNIEMQPEQTLWDFDLDPKIIGNLNDPNTKQVLSEFNSLWNRFITTNIICDKQDTVGGRKIISFLLQWSSIVHNYDDKNSELFKISKNVILDILDEILTNHNPAFHPFVSDEEIQAIFLAHPHTQIIFHTKMVLQTESHRVRNFPTPFNCYISVFNNQKRYLSSGV